MAAAMARAVIGESLAVPRVLHARTAGAAHACGADGWLGTLALGQQADLTLLEAMPASPQEWRALAVQGTVLGGRGA